MANKEQKLTDELQKCRENIQRTKDLIAYHRDILRKQERKADEIAAKLDKEKMKSLLGMIHDGGLDIDSLRNAVSSGQSKRKQKKGSRLPQQQRRIQMRFRMMTDVL